KPSQQGDLLLPLW
uniref:Uncharacterized protein n=1 Tax=Solanum lycopersicum TaxID=4081 RepID=A0A3Q7J7Y9_SOLLC